MNFSKAYYLWLVFLILPLTIFGQREYPMNEFSEKYFGKIIMEKDFENKISPKATISIWSKKTNEEIVTINNLELRYRQQVGIIFKDFNFDGLLDLAICDGVFSYNFAPSFKIYLEKNNTLVYSPEFTRLSHEYNGMFEVDYKKQIIQTGTNSGHSWHELSTFKVINNIPRPISILETKEDDFPYQTLKTIVWDGDKKTETIEKIIDFKEVYWSSINPRIIKLLSFELTNKKKLSSLKHTYIMLVIIMVGVGN